MRTLLLIGALAGCLAGCAAPAKQLLRINGDPDEALVHINDRYVGKLGRLEKQGIKLVPGEYRVTIDANGYFPHDEIVTIVDAQPPQPMNVALEEVPD